MLCACIVQSVPAQNQMSSSPEVEAGSEEVTDDAGEHTGGRAVTVVTSIGTGSNARGKKGEANTGLEPTPIAGGFGVRSQSAGDGFAYPFGLWAAYSHSDYEDDFIGAAARSDFEADSDAVFLGIDVSPWDNYVFGVALGFDQTDIDTTFNAGEQDIDSYSILPYMSGYISDPLGVDFDLSFDMVVGWSDVEIDQFRTLAGTRITSSTDATRWLFAGTSMPGSSSAIGMSVGAAASWCLEKTSTVLLKPGRAARWSVSAAISSAKCMWAAACLICGATRSSRLLTPTSSTTMSLREVAPPGIPTTRPMFG